MKYIFYNDTQRNVWLHPATDFEKLQCSREVINPLEIRDFIVPEGHNVFTKLWDYGGEDGLTLLVWTVKES